MKNKTGFTIIEIIIVIGIIAVLTVIVFPSITDIRKKNRDTERVSDISAIQLALSLYYNQNGYYPNDLNVLVPKYIPADSLIPPNSDVNYQYEYVPLARGNSSKCTFYHLGTKLELSSAQIDTANLFSSKADSISNGYNYCGGYTGEGLDNYTNDHSLYTVHP